MCTFNSYILSLMSITIIFFKDNKKQKSHDEKFGKQASCSFTSKNGNFKKYKKGKNENIPLLKDTFRGTLYKYYG